MFYVHTMLNLTDYKLVDFTSKEEQRVSRDEIIQRVESGEIIVGVVKINDIYVMREKGKKGKLSLEDYAILTDRLYLIDEFDCEKNGTTPDKVAFGNNNKFSWRCPKGHSYVSAITKRTNTKRGCPFCHHHIVIQGETDFETYCKTNNLEYLLDEWDYEKNSVLPSEIFPNRHEKVFWLCLEKKHSYESLPSDRIQGGGCSYCHSQTSFPEQTILYYMKQFGLYVDNRFKYDNKYEIDIYLPEYKIGIEYDGRAWHSSKDSIRRDEKKNKVLSDAGIKLIRLREVGCSQIELYDAIEIPVSDLDTGIKELKQVLSNLGVQFEANINTKRDRQAIQSQYLSSKKEQSIKITHPHIAAEWNYDKNGDLKPEMFSYGSEEKVWWRCKNCGSEYKSTIFSRCINKHGCPSCARFNQCTKGTETFVDYSEIEPFWSDSNPPMEAVSFASHTPLSITCPECNFSEIVNRLDQRVIRQEGLTCKNCNYHVEVTKWKKEKEDFIKQKEIVDELADEFLSFYANSKKS